jgi:hypothetical protein
MGVISNGLGSTNIKDGRGFILFTVFTVPTTVVIEPFTSHFFINGFILTFLLLPRKNRQIGMKIYTIIHENINNKFGVVIVLAVILGNL